MEEKKIREIQKTILISVMILALIAMLIQPVEVSGTFELEGNYIHPIVDEIYLISNSTEVTINKITLEGSIKVPYFMLGLIQLRNMISG